MPVLFCCASLNCPVESRRGNDLRKGRDSESSSFTNKYHSSIWVNSRRPGILAGYCSSIVTTCSTAIFGATCQLRPALLCFSSCVPTDLLLVMQAVQSRPPLSASHRTDWLDWRFHILKTAPSRAILIAGTLFWKLPQLIPLFLLDNSIDLPSPKKKPPQTLKSTSHKIPPLSHPTSQ